MQTNRKAKMSKIRMNTEFRNKILNRYVDNAETENTQEREAYLQAREKVDALYPLVLLHQDMLVALELFLFLHFQHTDLKSYF